MSGIKGDESGVYRCRVDFREAQTRNSLVNVTVIGRHIRVIIKGVDKRGDYWHRLQISLIKTRGAINPYFWMSF